jgi:hypothetical protein
MNTRFKRVSRNGVHPRRRLSEPFQRFFFDPGLTEGTGIPNPDLINTRFEPGVRKLCDSPEPFQRFFLGQGLTEGTGIPNPDLINTRFKPGVPESFATLRNRFNGFFLGPRFDRAMPPDRPWQEVIK